MKTEIEQYGDRCAACYISRRPYADSIEDLSFKEDLPFAFQRYDIAPKPDVALAVTLVERGEVEHARIRHKNIGQVAVRNLIPKILKPAETPTAVDPLELKVIGVRYLGRRIRSRRSVALMLDDADGILQAERELYTGRLSEEIYWKQYEPHITIAKLEPINAIDDILDWVAQRCPPSICVQPVSASEITHNHKHTFAY